ncbi:MAG: hypothetical protein J1F35_03050 [Erysipelotrichales bacterium]|nr:hypothetical protein [Erysipelotrichales bacterium]
MNRLMLFYILNNVIENYTNEEDISAATFKKIVDSNTFEEYDEDKCAYTESLIMAKIFSKIPYYKVTSTLAFISKKLVRNCQALDRYNILSKICVGCLEDIMPSIKRRVETESMEHVLELCYYYYQNGSFDNYKIKERLIKNICDPVSLFGTSVVENLNYSQNILFSQKETKDNLRDDISKSNAHYTRDVTVALRDKIVRCFDINTFEKFAEDIKVLICESDIEDKELLLETINSIIQKLYIFSISKWEDQVEDNYQLTLSSFIG